MSYWKHHLEWMFLYNPCSTSIALLHRRVLNCPQFYTTSKQDLFWWIEKKLQIEQVISRGGIRKWIKEQKEHPYVVISFACDGYKMNYIVIKWSLFQISYIGIPLLWDLCWYVDFFNYVVCVSVSYHKGREDKTVKR